VCDGLYRRLKSRNKGGSHLWLPHLEVSQGCTVPLPHAERNLGRWKRKVRNEGIGKRRNNAQRRLCIKTAIILRAAKPTMASAKKHLKRHRNEGTDKRRKNSQRGVANAVRRRKRQPSAHDTCRRKTETPARGESCSGQGVLPPLVIPTETGRLLLAGTWCVLSVCRLSEFATNRPCCCQSDYLQLWEKPTRWAAVKLPRRPTPSEATQKPKGAGYFSKRAHSPRNSWPHANKYRDRIVALLSRFLQRITAPSVAPFSSGRPTRRLKPRDRRGLRAENVSTKNMFPRPRT